MDEEKRTTNKAIIPAASRIRFGPYEVDLRTAELRKNDRTIRLQEQPFLILAALLEHPGELVLREEIRHKLWPDNTVVEFDHGINAAVKRLRDALCESVEKPRYIETLARKGYRFIAKVEVDTAERTDPPVQQEESRVEAKENVDSPAASELRVPNPPVSQSKRKIWWIVAAGIAIVALWAGIAEALRMRSSAQAPPEITRLTFDSGLTTDPAISPDGKLLAYATDRDGAGRLHIWVQQFIRDGQAVQLTRGGDDDHQPAFSSNGSKIAFRSERDGGGIYIIPAIGGDATLVAKSGRDPRFSPDGKWIAYWKAERTWVAGSGAIYLVPSAGGLSHTVVSDLSDAGVPQWSEDGRRLIVWGRKIDRASDLEAFDWWVVPAEGGTAIPTGAFALLKEKGFDGFTESDGPRVADWRGNELLFSARLGDSRNVWKVHIDRSNWRVMGDPQRLTSGTGLDTYPSLTADGHLLFASMTSSSDIWIVPVDTDNAKPVGPLRRITETIGPHQFASLSTDGKLLAYSSLRYGRPQAWIKNLESGTLKPVASGAAVERVSQLSSDGSLLVYTTSDENRAGFVVPLRGGAADQFSSNCDTAYDVSPDDKVVLYRSGNAIRAVDLVSRRDSLFMPTTKGGSFQHKFSPDGRWVTFMTVPSSNHSQIFVAALREGGVLAPENEWIPMTGDEGWADKPRWSPSGNFIYFLSNRDGFFCLWAQRIGVDSKQPVGPPVSIAHFHGSRLSVGNVGAGRAIEISVARDKIALNLGEVTGNIWTTDVSH